MKLKSQLSKLQLRPCHRIIPPERREPSRGQCLHLTTCQGSVQKMGDYKTQDNSEMNVWVCENQTMNVLKITEMLKYT